MKREYIYYNGLILLVLIFISYPYYKAWRINSSCLQTVGTILQTINDIEGGEVQYVYYVNGKKYEEYMPLETTVFGKISFPKTNEKYFVKYVEGYPSWSKILLNSPHCPKFTY